MFEAISPSVFITGDWNKFGRESQILIMGCSGHRKILHSCTHFHARKRKEHLSAQIWFYHMISLPLFLHSPIPFHKPPFLIISLKGFYLFFIVAVTSSDSSFPVIAQLSPVGFFHFDLPSPCSHFQVFSQLLPCLLHSLSLLSEK